MTNLILILIAASITNNFVLTYFLGICPFIGVSNRIDSAVGLGIATTFVMTMAATVTWLIYYYILVPRNLVFLQYVAFIIVIASFVQFVEMFIRKVSPVLYKALGIFLPLITTNCAILGLCLFIDLWQIDKFATALVLSFGAGIGFTLAICIMAGIRENLKLADVPESLKDAPITLITAGLLSLAFMGFAGMIK